MNKLISISLFIFLLMSCAATKKVKGVNEMPACLQTIINTMTAEPNGSPQSVAMYNYKNRIVYYVVSPCCDKYNIVYDSACNILGYPDGGFTGKGDGKMTDFKSDAVNEKIIWLKDKTGKSSN